MLKHIKHIEFPISMSCCCNVRTLLLGVCKAMEDTFVIQEPQSNEFVIRLYSVLLIGWFITFGCLSSSTKFTNVKDLAIKCSDITLWWYDEHHFYVYFENRVNLLTFVLVENHAVENESREKKERRRII